MTMHDMRTGAQVDNDVSEPTPDQLQAVWNRVVGRRSFLRQAGLASAAAVPVAAVAASGASAKRRKTNRPTKGDFAILRFLCAAEILESDLWEQYARFGGQASSERPRDGANHAYVAALMNLDGDMPQYISDNTDDEESHQSFINGYLMSKGQQPVSLERFRKLPPSKATGGGTKPTLTNLMALNVDTSWYLRYRAENNPDFGATFGQAVNIKNQAAIPVDDKETPPGNDAPVPVPPDAAHQRMQAIANSAGFHFAMIEQGGSSLYTTMALKTTSLEVLRIVVAIGGVETNHFSLWHDKAGNAVNAPLAGVKDPKTGTFFPNLNQSGGEATQTNLILPEPCEFIPGLPKCSVVRPTLDSNAGAMAAVRGLTADGLFTGQSPAFFRAIKRLAREADEAVRQLG
jgi:Ferritin-like domain